MSESDVITVDAGSVGSGASFAWSDAYLLGHSIMDRTHREFVEVVNAMLSSNDAGFADRLQAFITHAESHFGEEDRWMAESGFPAMDCHVDEHAAVLRSARDVLERVVAGDHAIGRELAAELARWFPGHADYLDSALAHWLVKKRFGGAPLVLRRQLSPTSPEVTPDGERMGR
jgi:hemerythrin